MEPPSRMRLHNTKVMLLRQRLPRLVIKPQKLGAHRKHLSPREPKTPSALSPSSSTQCTSLAQCYEMREHDTPMPQKLLLMLLVASCKLRH